jgi:LacI family transcriptional regulator
MSVTSRDVARAAGVSQATVSRVLNGERRVADETRARVVAAMERLRYTPNAVARGLVTSRTDLVGVVVSDIVNPFYPQFLETIHRELARHDMRVVFSNGDRKPSDEQAATLMEQRVDGIIFTSVQLDSKVPAQLVTQRFPFVLANRYVDGVDCDLVDGDNEGGARLAAEHLLERGHRRIGVILGHSQASTSRDRFGGFRDRLLAEGVEIDDELLRSGNFSYEAAYGEALDLLGQDHRPTAVFCVNDLTALAVLNAARRLRVRVPTQLSVIGFDDIELASWEAFELTTVRQPLSEMARTAVDLLTQRIEAPESTFRQLRFPSLLVTRKTTGMAPRK